MPIYEYFCPACKSEFELRLAFTEFSATAPCPKCMTTSSRLVSSFACKTGSNLQATEKAFRKPAREQAGRNKRAVKPGTTTRVKSKGKPGKAGKQSS
jgi:putative FmdB family regulatory protein